MSDLECGYCNKDYYNCPIGGCKESLMHKNKQLEARVKELEEDLQSLYHQSCLIEHYRNDSLIKDIVKRNKLKAGE